MILKLLLALSAVTVHSQQVHHNGLRRLRQLDLSPQDTNSFREKEQKTGQVSTTLEAVNNGYLPPVSASSLAKKIISAQSQQTFDFSSVDAVQNELCKPPFEAIFCGLETSKTESGIPKPSRDLTPPFNDLNQSTNLKDEAKKTINEVTTKKSLENFSVYTAESHNVFTSTTKKPTTKSHEPIKKIEVTKPVVSSEAPNLNKGEATNELRSYLPPQPDYSGAAQTSVDVVRPPDQRKNDREHHHDHHGHHHHGNICEDPFHSFLCTPLKARKRITGALPSNFRGQSSSVQYQKVLPSSDKETAPSNTFQTEYSSPKVVPSFSQASTSGQPIYKLPQTTPKRVVSTTTTTTTTLLHNSSPKIILQPSITNGKFHLPPSTSNIISGPLKPVAPIPAPSKPIPPISAPLKPIAPISAPLKPIIPISPILKPTVPEQKDRLEFFSTTVVPSTLKITSHSKSSSVYSPSLISVTTKKPAVSIPFVKSNETLIVPSPTNLKEYSSSTTNAILPIVPNLASLSSNEDRFYLPPNLNSAPSFISTTTNIRPVETTFTPLPTFSTYAPLPSNTIRLASLPKLQPVITTTAKPLPTVKYVTQSSIPVSFFTTTSRPFSSASRSSDLNVSYLPPQPKLQSASNIIPTTTKVFTTTTSKPTTRKLATSTAKLVEAPSFEDRSYLPPDRNVEPAAAQISSTAVVRPQVKNPFHHGRDLCTDPFHSFLCVSSKPRKRITGALPPGLRPDSSNVNGLIVNPAPSFQNEKRVKPEKPLETSQSQDVGYSYPRPSNPISSSANTILSTTAAPGYSYPKPEKIFPSPTQKKEEIKLPTTSKPKLVASEARVLTGYEYPKPVQKFPLPTEQEIVKTSTTTKSPTTGYSYPKPQKPFPLPTEQKEVRYSNPKTLDSSTLSNNKVSGYSYPKPQQSFNLPEKKGYFYPKPEKKFDYPTESKSKSQLSQTESKVNLLEGLGSAEFIPVNKLEKREQPSNLSSGLRKFGERLKKLEKTSSN